MISAREPDAKAGLYVVQAASNSSELSYATLSELEAALQELRGQTVIVRWGHVPRTARIEVQADGSIYDGTGSRHVISFDGSLRDTRFAFAEAV